MNSFDIIVLALIALSGLFAFIRGFVREVLSVGAWVGAGFVTYLGFRPAQPILRGFIHQAWLADIIDVVGLFILSLLVFSVFVGLVSSSVRASALSSLDRMLGLLFGVVRAIVLLCLGYVILSRLFPPANWPDWIADARSRPLLAEGGSVIEQIIPHAMLDQGTKAMGDAGTTFNRSGSAVTAVTKAARELKDITNGTGDAPADPSNPAYDADQRRALNRAIEQAGGHPGQDAPPAQSPPSQ